MTMTRKGLGKGPKVSNPDGPVGPETLSKSLRHKRYFYEPFVKQPFSWTITTDGYGNPTGTTGNVNGIHTGFNNFAWQVKGTQTIVVPSVTTDHAYDFGLDQTLADGFELNPSTVVVTNATYAHPLHYTVGTDEAYFRLLFSAEDVSGADLTVGFRLVEAYQTAVASYDTYAGIRVLGDSSSAAGAITLVNELDASATAATDTTDTLADGTAVEFEVRIVGTKARFFINGASPTIDLRTFAFTSGDVVMPFVFFLNTTDVVGELKFIRMEGGLLADHPGVLLS